MQLSDGSQYKIFDSYVLLPSCNKEKTNTIKIMACKKRINVPKYMFKTFRVSIQNRVKWDCLWKF